MNDTIYNNILAIDTATRRLNLALQYGADRLVKSSDKVIKSHGQIILRKIEHLFISAEADIDQLQAIVIGTGPGSFTGLRIGLAAAKGIAVARSIPVVGVTLFEAAAYRLRSASGNATILVPSRRDEFYLASIDSGRLDRDSIRIAKTGQLTELIKDSTVYGIGFDLRSVLSSVVEGWTGEEMAYEASDLLAIGIDKLKSGDIPALETLEPVYLQKAIAEVRFDERHGKN